jgi:hypothetical protein
MDDLFKDLSGHVEACFDAVSVMDICERAQTLGVRKPGTGQKYAYVI